MMKRICGRSSALSRSSTRDILTSVSNSLYLFFFLRWGRIAGSFFPCICPSSILDSLYAFTLYKVLLFSQITKASLWTMLLLSFFWNWRTLEITIKCSFRVWRSYIIRLGSDYAICCLLYFLSCYEDIFLISFASGFVSEQCP